VKRTLVSEIMTTPVVTAGEAMPCRQLAALLYAKGIGAVPVTGPAGQVLGVVSGADLTAKVGLPAATAIPPLGRPLRRERRKARARTAGELMTTPAITITPAATVGQAARIMRRHQVGRLPVTHPRTGMLAGIVTRSSLLRVYLRPGEQIRAEIEAEVLPAIPGADGGKLTVAVHDGIVTITGQAGCRSAIPRLVAAVLRAEGVVQVDQHLSYALDDRYPAVPVFW
jgi:CBS domain-containing protein